MMFERRMPFSKELFASELKKNTLYSQNALQAVIISKNNFGDPFCWEEGSFSKRVAGNDRGRWYISCNKLKKNSTKTDQGDDGPVNVK